MRIVAKYCWFWSVLVWKHSTCLCTCSLSTRLSMYIAEILRFNQAIPSGKWHKMSFAIWYELQCRLASYASEVNHGSSKSSATVCSLPGLQPLFAHGNKDTASRSSITVAAGNKDKAWMHCFNNQVHRKWSFRLNEAPFGWTVR